MTRFTLLAALLASLALTPGLADAKPKHCPPGLAKKEPACVPPGQAKKGVTAEEWSERDSATRDDGESERDGWRIGDRLDRDRWLVLEEGDRVTIDGREYVVVDTDNGTILRREDDWYRLPAAGEGYDWVRVGRDVVRIDAETRRVVEVIELARLLLN